jgi:aldose 1-epimerase
VRAAAPAPAALATVPLPARAATAPILPRVTADGGRHDFHVARAAGRWTPALERAGGTILSTRVAGGFGGNFTGVVVRTYAHAATARPSQAHVSQIREVSAGRAGIASRRFGVAPGGAPVDEYTLTNARGTSARCLTLGGIVVSLSTADRDGAMADVVLGYDTLDDYLTDRRFLGALVGRYANRIAGARFSLDGREHEVLRNAGAHHLHGGAGGFHRAVWSAEPFARDGDVGVVLRHVSPDGEEGFPGTLAVRVTYTLTADDALAIDYQAESDRATPVNFTQHLYVNLAGHDAGSVLGHELTVHASRFAPVDASLIPTGELRPVAGTPFDFTTPTTLGARLGADDEQLRRGGGYDHSFAIEGGRTGGDGTRHAARLRDPSSGRTLDVHTTEPAVQVYTGNALGDGPPGKGGHAYGPHDGVALETQHFPDSPNQPQFPSTILRPGDVFRARSVYRFSAS